jgi:hypothetical protein
MNEHSESEVLAFSTNPGKPIVIDETELEEARADERWRDFCDDADAYVAEAAHDAPAVH